jgi:glutathione S-transferase
VRRIFWCAARRDPHAFHSTLRHSNPLMRPLQHVSRRFVTRLATAGHRATDRAGEQDLAALPARLNQIDAWIEGDLLNGAELNAADFQIAPNIALLLRFEDLAPFINGRPAARLAQRIAPHHPGQIDAVLPTAWLAPLHATVGEAPQPGGL